MSDSNNLVYNYRALFHGCFRSVPSNYASRNRIVFFYGVGYFEDEEDLTKRG